MSLVLKPDQMISLECTDALDEKGYVLAISGGKFRKARPGDTPMAVAFRSTKNPITGTAEANKQVPALMYGVALVYAKIPAGGDSIAKGDIVCVNQASGYEGTVIKFVEKDTTTAWATTYDSANAETVTDEIIAASRYSRFIVGTALDDLAASAAEVKTGLIKVVLHMGRR